MRGHADAVVALGFSVDGGSSFELVEHFGPVHALALSPAGSHLTSASTDGSAALSWGAYRVAADLEAWTQDDGFGRQPTEEAYFQSRQQLNHGLIIAGAGLATVSWVSLGVTGLSLLC